MKNKSEYRIIYERGFYWLQCNFNGKWKFIRRNATSEKDCSKGLGWSCFPSSSYLCSSGDPNLLELYVQKWPHIEYYFNFNKYSAGQLRKLEDRIIYL